MTFNADSAATIRDRALADWRARYLLKGEDLDITEGSDAYNEIDALALEFEGLGLGAQEAANRVLLRFARGQDLDDFAEDDGTARKPASAARRVLRCVGPASTSTPVAGASLATAGGLRFTPIDPTTGAALSAIVTDGSGNADVTCECTSTGTSTNLVTDTVLTWSSAPTGFAATGTVVSGSGAREGEDAETDDALRNRLLERRKERPASGNRADWRAWGLDVAGVGDAFVHPCTRPPQPPPAAFLDQQIRTDKPGCVVVIPVNPSPAADSYVQNADGTLGAGLDPSYSRRPSADLCTAVAGYIDGTLDAEGNEVTASAQKQLYPATMFRESWGVVRPERVLVDVTIQVRVANDALFVFTGTRTITAVTDSTHITVSSGADLVPGAKIAVLYPVDGGGLRTVIRGGWAIVEVAGRSGADLTLVAPLPSTVGLVGAEVRSDPGVWSDVRREVLRYFDAFGSGAVSTPGRSSRFPDPTWGAPDTIVPARILALTFGVNTIVDAAVTLPAARSVVQLGYVPVANTVTIERLT